MADNQTTERGLVKGVLLGAATVGSLAVWLWVAAPVRPAPLPITNLGAGTVTACTKYRADGARDPCWHDPPAGSAAYWNEVRREKTERGEPIPNGMPGGSP